MQLRTAPLALALLIGICIDHFGLSLLDRYPNTSATTTQVTPSVTARSVAVCELSSEQIEHLSARIAPAVVEHLATSGLGNVAVDAKIAARQHQAAEQDKAEKASAVTQATQLVDQLISNRQITPQGMRDAEQLLQQTGQTDQIYLLHARIAVAVNKGELTPAQAGLMPPRQ